MTSIRESNTKQENFSLGVAKQLFSLGKSDNIVFSPLSLQVVPNIIAAGSKGPTQQQIIDFLRFKSIYHLNLLASQLVSVILKDAAPAGGPRLSVANGVWIEQSLSLQHSFKQIVSFNYKATLASVDLQNKAVEVTKEVNLWAIKETNGLIEEILPPRSVNNLTLLIFTNALYFKGAWNEKFYDSMTKDYDFHLLNGSSIKVPFMRSCKKHFIRAFDDFKGLGLPYEQGEDERQFSMYIFLPNAKVKVGDFRIPKFKFSFRVETSQMFEGARSDFTFLSWGLTNIVESLMDQNLYVSNIFQKSFIEVNEEGTLDSFDLHVIETPLRELQCFLFDDISGACMPRNIRLIA